MATTLPLQGREVLLVVLTVVTLWCSALLYLHVNVADKTLNGFWGTLPSAWDHPEPNYLVSHGIGEFWSVLTTIPVAGALLFYQGRRFAYGPKVMLIYGLTCCMYTLACFAHLTLQRHVFSTTVTAVMSNALLTFVMFSHVVHRALQSVLLRLLIVAVSEVLLIGTVAQLPYAINHGGVWTLFIVQAPGVFLATGLALMMARLSTRKEEKTTYDLVFTSGCLLSSAMVLSLVECLIGFEWGYLQNFWGFPYLHVAIHLLEQLGIYIFGVGVAALEVLLLRPKDFQNAKVSQLRWLIYFYCEPSKDGKCSVTATPSPTEPSGGESPPLIAEFINGALDRGLTQRVEKRPEGKGTTLQKRKRTQSPGVASLAA
ncbi:unnamed protein product [Cladocopium goreaui]|uniref:Uncharacterized protein n=1 Tax=Cladocopium goreaui TaxID=2562237 RepID=A0A9P1BKB3_9DINO|nr:unnamed protein product [Cladocopium goreaui]